MWSLRVRVSGLIWAILAAGIAGFGYYLTCMALNWAMPLWVPPAFRLTPLQPLRGLDGLKDTGVGQVAAFLLVFGGLGAANAASMVVLGRRNWLLTVLLLGMVAIFVGMALWRGVRFLPGFGAV